MKNNMTINSMNTRMDELKASMKDDTEIKTLQNEQKNAQSIIGEIEAAIVKLESIQEYDSEAIAAELLNLDVLKGKAQGKLNLINDALETAMSENNTIVAERNKIEAGITTLKELSNFDFEKAVNSILDLTPPASIEG